MAINAAVAGAVAAAAAGQRKPGAGGTRMVPPGGAPKPKPSAGPAGAPGTSLTARPRTLPGGASKPLPEGGASAETAPAKPTGKPAWQVLRENGQMGTGSAAGNRAAAAGLPGFGMDKPLPTERPGAPGPTVSSVPPEVAGRMAQLLRERGNPPPAAPGVDGSSYTSGMSELPMPSSPDPMAGGADDALRSLPGFGPAGMSKPMMPPPAAGVVLEAGGASPYGGVAQAALLSRLQGLQSMNGGGLQGGPSAFGDPGFLSDRPGGGVGGGPGVAGLGMLRDPRQLRTDLGGVGGRAMGGF